MNTLRTACLLVALATLMACVSSGGSVSDPASGNEAAIANMNLGAGYLRQGNTTLAIERLQRALAQDPNLVQAHTTIGERLCGELRSLRPVRAIVRSHHERLDGSGYPDGLRGDAIPLTAQIVGIVDAYDAMTTTRPYRAALGEARACDELERDAREGRLNPEIVRVFLGLDRAATLVEAGNLLPGV